MREAYFAREKRTGLRVRLTIAANLTQAAGLQSVEAIARRLSDLAQLSQAPSFPEGLLPIREVIQSADYLAYTEKAVPWIPLSELLRARTAAKRPIGFSEAVLFLRSIAEALDFLLENGHETILLPCEEIGLTSSDLATGTDAAPLTTRPLSEWNDLNVLFSAVCLPPGNRRDPGEPSPATERTISWAAQLSEADLHPVPSFARLVYRVLNGSELDSAARYMPHAFIPTVALGSDSNCLIRDVVCQKRTWKLVTPVLKELCANQGVLWPSKRKATERIVAVVERSPALGATTQDDPILPIGEERLRQPAGPADGIGGAQLTIPARFLGTLHPASKLMLESPTAAMRDKGSVRGIHLVARDEFRIGRTRSTSDHLAWFWPRSSENDARTNRLSRNVHARLLRSGGRLVVFDNGSTHGTAWNGMPVPTFLATASRGDSAPVPVCGEVTQIGFDTRGILTLGAEYRIEVSPYPSGIQRTRIVNEGLWAGPADDERTPGGAVRFLPVTSEPALHQAVWILTDATFGSGFENPVRLESSGLDPVAGRIHYYRNHFWIETFHAGDTVEIDGWTVAPGDLVPLCAGQTVRFGSVEYCVNGENAS